MASFLFARQRRVLFISLAAFCCLLVLGAGAQSRAGFLGTAVGCALVTIFSIFHKTFSWKTFAGIMTSLAIAGSLFLADSHHIRDDLLLAGTDAWSANFTNTSRLVNDVRVEDDWFLLDEGECSIPTFSA
jgi:cell division protein FtsW (lipid II flippase)